MTKNILLVIPFLGYTGAERVIFTLLNNLDRTKVKPHLLIYSDDVEKNQLLKYLKEDVVVSAINFKGRFRYNIHNIIIGIHKTVMQYSIDSVLISDGSTNASISPFLRFIGPKGTRFIARESNLPSLYEKNKIVKFLYRRFYKSYDTIVAQSDDMVKDLSLEMDIPLQKIIKINNPLDYNFIKNLAEKKPEIYLPTDKINLLTIGRLTYQKGFDILLESFSSLENKDKYHLTIIGSGEELSSLTSLCNQLELKELVTFVAKVDNPYAIMMQADVYVSSSRWEGYPNVVIESLVCGLPVLSNNYPGGINEIITPENGIICDINVDFSVALQSVLNLGKVDFDNKYNESILNKYIEVF